MAMIAPALLEVDVDSFAAELSALAENHGNEVSITYMLAELARTAESLPFCVELETPHGIVCIIEDCYSRTCMYCERDKAIASPAIGLDDSTDLESLMKIGSGFLSGVR